jgi:hypothetical protein
MPCDELLFNKTTIVASSLTFVTCCCRHRQLIVVAVVLVAVVAVLSLVAASSLAVVASSLTFVTCCCRCHLLPAVVSYTGCFIFNNLSSQFRSNLQPPYSSMPQTSSQSNLSIMYFFAASTPFFGPMHRQSSIQDIHRTNPNTVHWKYKHGTDPLCFLRSSC